jgi:WD40 repeat protein
VWKLQWAHPQYGRILASCSFDRTVAIWEELNHQSSAADFGSAAHKGPPRKSNWKLRTRRDSQEPVTDIAFAPRSLGLQLATVSGDGYVRIYKPDDAHNLEFWHEQSFEASSSDASSSSSSGGGGGGGGGDGEEASAKRSRQLTSISWCEAHFCPPMLAVAAKDGSIRVWAFNEAFERWQVMHQLQGHTGAVHDIAWAPDTGRSFHLLASASSDGCLGVWAVVKSGEAGGALPGAADGAEGPRLGDGKVSRCMMKASAHGGREVWRVQWDISGMQLASSGDDRKVRLWRKKLQGMEFECFEEVSMDFRVNEVEPED